MNDVTVSPLCRCPICKRGRMVRLRQQRKRSITRLGYRTAVALTGVFIIYLEGMNQPAPGIWFAVGALTILVAVIPWRNC